MEVYLHLFKPQRYNAGKTSLGLCGRTKSVVLERIRTANRQSHTLVTIVYQEYSLL